MTTKRLSVCVALIATSQLHADTSIAVPSKNKLRACCKGFDQDRGQSRDLATVEVRFLTDAN
jgi:hypothetical protein